MLAYFGKPLLGQMLTRWWLWPRLGASRIVTEACMHYVLIIHEVADYRVFQTKHEHV